MDYTRVYINLINKAQNRITFERVERHHIIPRSQGGEDHCNNYAYLTIREHMHAHILLYKMGFKEQAFSIECFLKDSLNPESHRYKHPRIRYTRYLRKIIAFERARSNRLRNRESIDIKRTIAHNTNTTSS